VGTRQGLQRFIILFFIDLSTRKVEIAGIAPLANGLWMRQIARNFSDSEEASDWKTVPDSRPQPIVYR
jgi:hypothetical protein